MLSIRGEEGAHTANNGIGFDTALWRNDNILPSKRYTGCCNAVGDEADPEVPERDRCTMGENGGGITRQVCGLCSAGINHIKTGPGTLAK